MIDLKPACRQMSDLLVIVAQDQLTRSTPCTDFTVADLIEHVDDVAQGFTALARTNGEGPASGAGHAADPVDGWLPHVAGHVRTLGEAWDEPAAWHGSTDTGGVELANELWGKIALTEMVVHGWDLARSTNHPIDLPDETLRACLEHVAEFVPNAPVPELWGPAVDVPANASMLDHIVAIAGRAP